MESTAAAAAAGRVEQHLMPHNARKDQFQSIDPYVLILYKTSEFEEPIPKYGRCKNRLVWRKYLQQ